MHGKLPKYIYSDEAGAQFVVEYDGSFLGLYHTIDKDSGIVEYSVDDGEWKECSLWDHYALQFDRAAFSILEETLPEGHHSVKIRNSGRKDAQSKGYFIRIGALTLG